MQLEAGRARTEQGTKKPAELRMQPAGAECSGVGLEGLEPPTR